MTVCNFPNIEDRTEGKLATTIEWAKKAGLWKSKNGLFRNLVYLATYANGRGKMYDRKKGKGTKCVLGRDFAPNSFSFSIQRKEGDKWESWFFGGLIYSGPDVPLNGSFPALTVAMERYVGWGVHT